MSSPAGADPALTRVRRLATVLDSQFTVPGTSIRFGLDALLGLIPGVGDTVGALLGLGVVVAAWRRGAPAGLLLRMGLNLGVEWLVGLVPLLGDLFDVAFKANLKNLALLEAHLADDPAGRPATWQGWAALAGLGGVVVAAGAGSIWLMGQLVGWITGG